MGSVRVKGNRHALRSSEFDAGALHCMPMATTFAKFQVAGIGRAQLAAMRKKAGRLGMTLEEYVKKLIADDLKWDRLVANNSLSELSAPFRDAFKDTTEEEIGQLVEEGRARHHRRLSKG